MTTPTFVFFRKPKKTEIAFLQGGPDNEFSFGEYCFCWKTNDNLFVVETAEHLSVSYLDQVSGEEAEIIRWVFKDGILVIHRPWPGNTAFHFSPKNSCILTSHLHLFSQVGAKTSPAPKLIEPQTKVCLDLETRIPKVEQVSEITSLKAPRSIGEAALDLDAYLHDVIAQVPADTVLLLSGGIDSAGLAVLAAKRNLHCLTWVMSQDQIEPRLMPDVQAALLVAEHCRLNHSILEIDPQQLAHDIEAAVFLSEIKRGTLIDDMIVYIQVARHLKERGVTTVLLGEAADDALGCMPMNFRYYQGDDLLNKLRNDLLVGAPDDYAAISKLFAHFGINVIDPYLSKPVAQLGASLPLEMRIDRNHTIKPIIRQAFSHLLPMEVVNRKKEVSRDVSGVREEMQRLFGESQYRFYDIHKKLFRSQDARISQELVIEQLARINTSALEAKCI